MGSKTDGEVAARERADALRDDDDVVIGAIARVVADFPNAPPPAVTVRAIEKKRSPPGSSSHCVTTSPGVRKVVWRLHSGQPPPCAAKGKPAPSSRFDTLPAASMRMKKKAIAPGSAPRRVVRRWATCSKLVPNSRESASMS